jgi:hypothetical protein
MWCAARIYLEGLRPLHQADQARTDLAAIEDDLQFITGQLARLPSRAYLCRTLLIATASIWVLIGAVALLMVR